MNLQIEMIDESDEFSVESVSESIETSLRLAESYFLQGAEGLALECLQTGWEKYKRFDEILRVYSGGDGLRDRLIGRLAAFEPHCVREQERDVTIDDDDLLIAA